MNNIMNISLKFERNIRIYNFLKFCNEILSTPSRHGQTNFLETSTQYIPTDPRAPRSPLFATQLNTAHVSLGGQQILFLCEISAQILFVTDKHHNH